jgi:hypothetical protein
MNAVNIANFSLHCSTCFPKRFENFIGTFGTFCVRFVRQLWPRSGTDGNLIRFQEIQTFPSPMSSRFMRFSQNVGSLECLDIEGYMEVYWKSPELLVVVDSEQFNGWQQLHDSYLNGYPDQLGR